MLRIILFLIPFYSSSILANAQYSSPGFNLLFLGDWKPQDTASKEQISYYSQRLDVNLVGFYKLETISLDDINKRAYSLNKSHMNAEIGYPPSLDNPVKIKHSSVIESSKGYLASYYGSDSTNRHFRYLGIVTTEKIISLHIESRSQSEQSLKHIFDQLIDGLDY